MKGHVPRVTYEVTKERNFSSRQPKLLIYLTPEEHVTQLISTSFPAVSFKKYKTKTNPKMYTLMYFKMQSDQPRITRNALKKSNFRFIY